MPPGRVAATVVVATSAAASFRAAVAAFEQLPSDEQTEAHIAELRRHLRELPV